MPSDPAVAGEYLHPQQKPKKARWKSRQFPLLHRRHVEGELGAGAGVGAGVRVVVEVPGQDRRNFRVSSRQQKYHLLVTMIKIPAICLMRFSLVLSKPTWLWRRSIFGYLQFHPVGATMTCLMLSGPSIHLYTIGMICHYIRRVAARLRLHC